MDANTETKGQRIQPGNSPPKAACSKVAVMAGQPDVRDGGAASSGDDVAPNSAPSTGPPANTALLAKLLAAELSDRLDLLKFDELAGRVEARVDELRLDAFKIDLQCFYSQKDLSKLLGVATSTLEQWRSRGGGIPYTKCGKRCFYAGRDVEKYLLDGMRRSASDTPERDK